MNTETVLAIDVGGTTIKGELLTTDATDGSLVPDAVLARAEAPTPQGGPAAAEAIAEVGRRLIAQAPEPPVRAGVVVPGLVDAAAGVALYSGNIGWRDLPLVAELADRWSMPGVRIGNDVAAGGVAEARLGAGRDEGHLLFLPLGTGIAGAIVSGGRLLQGHRGETAELGHLPVHPGVACVCGGDGCLEAVASASAIARRYAERTGEPVEGAETVAARLGRDPDADAVWGEAITALSRAITATSLLASPALVVIGGGLADAGDRLLAPLRDAVVRHASIVEPPRVVASELGRRAGVLGAALLAVDGWREAS